MKKTLTFKIHKADRTLNQTKLVAHQLDPLEHIAIPGAVNELASDAPRSGEAKLTILISAEDALGIYEPGQIVQLTIEHLMAPKDARAAVVKADEARAKK